MVKGHSGPRAAINAVLERPEVSKHLNHGAWACLTWCQEPKDAQEPAVRQQSRVCKYGSSGAVEPWLRAVQALELWKSLWQRGQRCQNALTMAYEHA